MNEILVARFVFEQLNELNIFDRPVPFSKLKRAKI